MTLKNLVVSCLILLLVNTSSVAYMEQTAIIEFEYSDTDPDIDFIIEYGTPAGLQIGDVNYLVIYNENNPRECQFTMIVDEFEPIYHFSMYAQHITYDADWSDVYELDMDALGVWAPVQCILPPPVRFINIEK